MKKISSKINQLVLRGLLAEDQELFLNRLAFITNNNRELLEQLADGVVVGVSIKDEAAAIAWLNDRYKGNGWTIDSVSVTPAGGQDVRIEYKYTGKTKWFTTQEDADRYSRGYSPSDSSNEMDEKHQFQGTYHSNSSDCIRADKDWLEVEML